MSWEIIDEGLHKKRKQELFDNVKNMQWIWSKYPSSAKDVSSHDFFSKVAWENVLLHHQ